MMLAENELSLKLLPLYPIWLNQAKRWEKGAEWALQAWLLLERGWRWLGHLTLTCRSHPAHDTDFHRWGKGGSKQCPGTGWWR